MCRVSRRWRGLRWLVRLLRTYRLCDAQPRAPAQVQELLEKGANIEAVDNYGLTALHNAASNGHKEVVALLARASHAGAKVAGCVCLGVGVVFILFLS